MWSLTITFLLGILQASSAGHGGSANPLAAPPSPQRVLTVPREASSTYTLTRHSRTSAELRTHLRSFLPLFPPFTLDETTFEQWSDYAVAHPDEKTRFRPAPGDAPNLIVAYHPRFDEIMAFDLGLLRDRPELTYNEVAIPDEGIGEAKARERMKEVISDLEDAGVIEPGDYSAASARLSIWREVESRGEKRKAEWVVEYQYTMNRVVDGLDLVDAGLRIGISRHGLVSSFRMTDIEVTAGGTPNTYDLTLDEARTKLRENRRLEFPAASLVVTGERVGLGLPPEQSQATIVPAFIFDYVLRFPGGQTEPASVSRKILGTIALDTEAYEQLLP